MMSFKLVELLEILRKGNLDMVDAWEIRVIKVVEYYTGMY